MNEDKREQLLKMFYDDRLLFHRYVFAHRHKNESPEFHDEILRKFYSGARQVLVKCFRGAAKSTKAEEYCIGGVLFRDFRFPILIGNSYDRACERLAAIKHELETNEIISELFGSQVGPTWSYDEIVLANGARIKAFGARQSLRGAKHLDDRPDAAIVDDLEDEENVATEQARYKIKRWVNGSLIPALVPWGKIRYLGTPLHPKALIEEKSRDPSVEKIVVPISYIDPQTGEEKPSWPDRFPIDYIRNMRQTYLQDGAMTEYRQEYDCVSEDEASKPFQASMIRRGNPPPGFVATEIFVDPARTTNNKSARTGYAVWSWIGNKLYVRKAFGAFHKPDEIIKTIFDLDEEFDPVFVGVETDGLEEFIMQPLRAEQVKRGVTVPIVGVKAPKDKIGFITSLQPFYMAGDVTHCGETGDLDRELLEFPTGRIDVPNALAYALRMRAGRPVYEDFRNDHIDIDLQVNTRHPRYLAVSSRPAMTAALLVQHIDGCLRVPRAWVLNEPPLDALEKVIPEAILAGGSFTAMTPEEQMDKYVNNGVPAAFNTRKIKLLKGKPSATCVRSLQPFLTTAKRGLPAFALRPRTDEDQGAQWLLNAFARGYLRRLTASGTLEDKPEQNQYALVMEALESFASFITSGTMNTDEGLTFARTPQGRQYISILPGKQ